ncbi:MAG: hypothetical protein ACJ71K_01170 [Nitrososphaeraceae archaeon]
MAYTYLAKGFFNIYTKDQGKDLLTLNQITNMEKLFSYDIGENIEWIDVESPTYVDRNKDIVEKILLQMRSGLGGLD